MKSFFRILAFSALFALNSYSQSNLAGISGVVSDPSGGSITGATVVALNIQTGISSNATTNSSGYYDIENLALGQYTVTIEHPGFRRYIRENITLTTGQQLGLDISLVIGNTSESVTITADVPLTETRSSDVSQLFESKSIEGLPLGNRRTLNVLQLSGAAVFVSYPVNTPANVNPNFSLAGGRTQSQMAWIDGSNAQNIRIGAGQINLDPPVEAVQEVKVLSNNYAAEYGGSAGGVVIETTKSGGNQFHGSAYEYLRNNYFDAPGYFAPVMQGAKVSPEYRYNVFGGTVGGPIRKDKTFFFFSYEGTRLVTATTNTLTVPTLPQRNGDFSQTLTTAGKLIPIYDPNTTQLVGGSYVRTPFPGNIIPSSELDPVGVKVLNYYPLPNQAPSNIAGANNFSGNEVTGSPADFYLIKGDHNIGSKDKITGRYMRISGTSSLGSIYPQNGAGDPNNFAYNASQYIFASWTRILSPTRINDLRFTFNDRAFHNLSAGLGGDYPTKLGLTGVPTTAFPTFTVSSFSTLGAAQQERLQDPIQQQQIVDNFSWVHGRNAFKFGFEARRSYDRDQLLTSASGAFTFATTPTGLPGNSATGNGLASMLVGFPTAFSELATETLNRHSWYFAAFAQDDWTVTPSLTFNFGVRWEIDTPMVDSNNRMNGFDLNQINPVSGTPGVIKFLGLNGYTSTPYRLDWNNFGPRFGFAWKVAHSDKTVVRGGFGIFFAHPFDAGVPTANTLGFSLQATLNTPDNGITAPFFLRNGVPLQVSAPVLNDSYGAVPVGQNPNTAVTYFDQGRATGYSEQFNFGIQRQLSGSIVVEASVLGNLSRKLAVSNLSLDQIAPQVLTAQHDTQAYRPYPQFSNVSIQSPSIGYSNYYAGLFRIEKRYSYGLNFGANFTWSKLLGNLNDVGAALGNENGPFSNFYNRSADYGPLSNDVTKRASINTFYELPFGPGKRWLSNNFVGQVIGGWSLGVVGTVQTGPPITMITQTNSCNCFSAGSQRPNAISNPNLPSGQRSVAEWFNVAAFTQPANLTFGSEGVGLVRAPGLVDFDLSLARTFRIKERLHFELRGDFFNAFNHTNLGLPGTTFGSSSFGVISSAGPARQIELGARIFF
jgi:Carboxypeptidase regulatory-like domain